MGWVNEVFFRLDFIGVSDTILAGSVSFSELAFSFGNPVMFVEVLFSVSIEVFDGKTFFAASESFFFPITLLLRLLNFLAGIFEAADEEVEPTDKNIWAMSSKDV